MSGFAEEPSLKGNKLKAYGKLSSSVMNHTLNLWRVDNTGTQDGQVQWETAQQLVPRCRCVHSTETPEYRVHTRQYNAKTPVEGRYT